METSRSLGRIQRTPVVQSVRPTEAYLSIRPNVIQILDSTLREWMLLEGKTATGPTMVVLVNKKDDAKKLEVQRKVQGVSGNFEVLTATGRFGFSSPPLEQKYPQNAHFEPFIESGASIGLAGQEWSGSFGGYLQNESTGEVVGLTCAHTFCLRENDADGDLLELFPEGTIVVQPSVPDNRRRREVLAQCLEEKMKMKEILKPKGLTPPSYQLSQVLAQTTLLDAEYHHLEDQNAAECGRRGLADLSLAGGILRDYSLIQMTARRGLGTCASIPLIHPKNRLAFYEDEKVSMVGRTTGRAEGTVGGYILDAKVEHFATSFECAYVRGRGGAMSTMGDSGSFVIFETNGQAEALGYVFGDGTTDEIALETTWVIDLQDLCYHLREMTGQTYKVWTWAADGLPESDPKSFHQAEGSTEEVSESTGDTSGTGGGRIDGGQEELEELQKQLADVQLQEGSAIRNAKQTAVSGTQGQTMEMEADTEPNLKEATKEAQGDE